jgi:hypothetical protein
MAGRSYGPFTATELRRQALQGDLTEDAEISQDEKRWI